MARVPDAVIERLKREVALERLVTSSGVELKRRGKDLVGVCPFHDDGEASLIVTSAKNLFHCMGSGAAGSTIDWVMQTQNVSFRHAVELLRKDLIPADTPIRKRRPDEPLMDLPLAPDAEDHELAAQVIDYYHQQLKQSPKALAYLEQRGLVHGGVVGLPKITEKPRPHWLSRSLGPV
jgi:DNA primase